MPYFSIVSDLKGRKFLGKTRKDFKEINPQYHRFWLSVESLKENVQKISAQR